MLANRRTRPSSLAGAALLIAAAGCDPSHPTAPPAPAAVVPVPAAMPPARPGDGDQTFTLRGVVRAVDRDKGEVTIAHEAMPGFMGAMVMPFRLRDKALLDDLQPGDVVHGPMVVRFERGTIRDYRLDDLTVTGTAPTTTAGPALGFRKVDPLRVGDPVPDFAVTTQDGSTLRLSELRGRVVALTFIYTRCPLPDFCPAVDGKFAELTRIVAANPDRAARVRLVSISFDPKHDTPEVLRAHAGRRGAKEPWSFAAADPADLARVGPLLGLDYYPERDEFAHNLTTAVIGPDGRLARLELGRGWTPADLARTMIGLIPRAEPATTGEHGTPRAGPPLPPTTEQRL